MQTTIRNFPVPTTELARIVPGQPIGEERHGHRHPMPARDDHRRAENDAASAHPAPLLPSKSRLPRATRPDIGGEAIDGQFSTRSFARRDLLASASFQAQHLGQDPPHRNEALLRTSATGAYRQASGLSVQYLGSFQPVDLRV